MQIESSLIIKAYSFSQSPSIAVSCGEIQLHQRRDKTKFLAKIASKFSDNTSDPGDSQPKIIGKSLGARFDLIYKYSRAYTLKGTVLSIVSSSLLAIQNLSDITPSFFLGVLQAIVGGCLANLYVAGINQLSDVEIDRVNKPYLPLASGELSVTTGILLTSLYALLGFVLGLMSKSWPLRLGLFLWYAFGTVYSVNIPLLRWKRIPALAALCIWSVLGAIVPILFHLNAQTCIKGRALLLSKHAIFVFGIMSIFGIVIALFKDIPDVEGDKINGINSLALQFGQKQAFWICIWLLEMAYGMGIVIGLSSAHIWIRYIMVIGHSILGFILWRNSNLVDLKSNEAIESFYQFIWKIESPLIIKAYSFSQSPSIAVSCGGRVSRVDVKKNVNSNRNLLQFRKLNCYNQHVTEIQLHQRKDKTKFLAKIASKFSDNTSDPGDSQPKIIGKSLGARLDLIYKYSRAYTLKGTVLSIVSSSLLAVQNLSDITSTFFLGVLQAIVGGCLANLYVAGINQLSDVEIDRVNKPYLPLASGELSVTTGILLTSLYALLGFVLGLMSKSWPLRLGLFLWYAFGTVYSVNIPLLRWKRIPALAALCIWSVLGAIVPILFHLNAQTFIKGRALLLSKHAIFVFGFMSIFGIVIALFKDIPDVEGDKINGINSLALQFGQKQAFWICIWLLEMAYGMGIVIGLSSAHIWIRYIMVIGHSILGFILWRNSNLVDLKSNEAIESFYQFIWKLYYVEYLLVPFLRF
ncbi:hypothetical protein E3N88_05799 [Mikania micrantha]|uniref:Uncharacterized protein n=1 Tax=Mikania micrantha TaxID=192012 RepID=A0A5N6PLZ6_9ASTR|nr:hypothetical protein E3N88_05799 [Mikania micrantha]